MLTHDARQGGELHHQLRGEVRLRESRRLARDLRIRGGEPERLGELRRQLLDARRLLEHRSEFRLEGDALQIGLKIRQGFARVRLVEELRVLVPRCEHGFVADTNGVVVHRAVGDGDEMREEVAGGGVLDGEVPLVLAHHHHEHLLRQREERGIETAEDGGGGLDQVDHLVDEPARSRSEEAERRRRRRRRAPARRSRSPRASCRS